MSGRRQQFFEGGIQHVGHITPGWSVREAKFLVVKHAPAGHAISRGFLPSWRWGTDEMSIFKPPALSSSRRQPAQMFSQGSNGVRASSRRLLRFERAARHLIHQLRPKPRFMIGL
jgi:hypothetical protein